MVTIISVGLTILGVALFWGMTMRGVDRQMGEHNRRWDDK